MSLSAAEYVGSFSRPGAKVNDLSRISKLLENLGNPHKSLKFVHTAGTNGKGSVVEYMSCILIEAGYKTGQFTSPFVERYNDRIRINGRCIPDSRLDDICLRVREAVKDESCSQFEITLAVALIYFKEENCDIVFLETGIGGLLDATNIIESPLVSVITSVSLDHTEVLGNTVKEIAMQKAGIIKNGCPVVLSADNVDDTVKTVQFRSAECKSSFIMPKPEKCTVIHSDIYGSSFVYKDKEYCIGMCGRHQVSNALTALEAVMLLRKQYKYNISDENISRGLSAARVMLRTEILCSDPLVIADGGHNISGIDSLIATLESIERPLIGVVGMVRGKAAEYAGKKLSRIFNRVICVDGYIDSNIPAEELAGFFDCPAFTADYKTAVSDAVLWAEKNHAAVVICGSLYLASAERHEFKKLF